MVGHLLVFPVFLYRSYFPPLLETSRINTDSFVGLEVFLDLHPQTVRTPFSTDRAPAFFVHVGEESNHHGVFTEGRGGAVKWIPMVHFYFLYFID